MSLDTVYMEGDETKEDHLEFKTDAAGVELRYKILIKDMVIVHMLYNTGSSIEEIPF